jgi:hypothetical protein
MRLSVMELGRFMRKKQAAGSAANSAPLLHCEPKAMEARPNV